LLIAISDLHHDDGTATMYRLDAESVRRAIGDWAAMARRAKAKEVRLLLLGDIFDLNRSEAWQAVPEPGRPWGENPSPDAARAIFETVVADNREVLEAISGSWEDQGFPVQPERTYIPGNHDRLCNADPVLRRRVREVLGLPGGDEAFETSFLDWEHGVFGRHGHEWDPYNFELVTPDPFRLWAPAEEFAGIPIGDAISAEIAARLPRVAEAMLPESHPQRGPLADHFRQLFDVRPLAAIVQWLAYETDRYGPEVKAVINGAINLVGHDFDALPFVQTWIASHDERSDLFDSADRVQLLLFILETFKLNRFEKVLKRVEKMIRNSTDHYPSMAAADFIRLDADPELRGAISYVIYGHTHQATQWAIEETDDRWRMYLNTGTWRPARRPAATRRGFVGWGNLTWTAFYKPGEVVNGQVVTGRPWFESWKGSLSLG
jgi:UDP-2,3-diacylglucosamine pyrophosphatase LpxH